MILMMSQAIRMKMRRMKNLSPLRMLLRKSPLLKCLLSHTTVMMLDMMPAMVEETTAATEVMTQVEMVVLEESDRGL